MERQHFPVLSDGLLGYGLLLWFAKLLSRLDRSAPAKSEVTSDMTVVCISDTHNTKPEIPSGDILIHAGDLSDYGTFEEVQNQLGWIKNQPHSHKIVVAGNHDFILDPDFKGDIKEKPGCTRTDLDFGDIHYLCASTTTLQVAGRSVRVYGSPLTPRSGPWAFQYPPKHDIWRGRIPQDADIVITHGPPALYRDVYDGKHWGCPHLLRELRRVSPRLALFGHIHSGHGRDTLSNSEVQSLYDKFRLGQGSVSDFVSMSMVLAARLIGSWHSQTRTTVMANVAVVHGRKNVDRFPATVLKVKLDT